MSQLDLSCCPSCQASDLSLWHVHFEPIGPGGVSYLMDEATQAAAKEKNLVPVVAWCTACEKAWIIGSPVIFTANGRPMPTAQLAMHKTIYQMIYEKYAKAGTVKMTNDSSPD